MFPASATCRTDAERASLTKSRPVDGFQKLPATAARCYLGDVGAAGAKEFSVGTRAAVSMPHLETDSADHVASAPTPKICVERLRRAQSGMASDLSSALDRFIAEERPDLTRESAARLLMAEALISMGLMQLPAANRARGAQRTARRN